MSPTQRSLIADLLISRLLRDLSEITTTTAQGTQLSTVEDLPKLHRLSLELSNSLGELTALHARTSNETQESAELSAYYPLSTSDATFTSSKPLTLQVCPIVGTVEVFEEDGGVCSVDEYHEIFLLTNCSAKEWDIQEQILLEGVAKRFAAEMKGSTPNPLETSGCKITKLNYDTNYTNDALGAIQSKIDKVNSENTFKPITLELVSKDFAQKCWNEGQEKQTPFLFPIGTDKSYRKR